MPRDHTRFRRLGVLAPAALSACMDASVLAVPTAGAIVSTVLQELSKAFMLKKWFHGTMSTKEAEELMMEKGKNGSFLVRESLARPGEFVLTVRARGRVSHVIIRRQDDKYDVGSGEKFEDLVGLVEHFRSYPIIENSGTVLRLLQPISGTALRVHDLQKKVEEIQSVQSMQTDGVNLSLEREFMLLRMLENQNIFTSYEGEKLENATKNRYRNILPYDQTRVILRDRVQGTDYINANYIRALPISDVTISSESSNESLDDIKAYHNKDCSKLEKEKKYFSCDELRNIESNLLKSALPTKAVKEKFYIATQGCLPNTIDDFWHMVWQEDVRIIVMLTQESEKGKSKCEKYWPSVGKTENHAHLTTELQVEVLRPHYTLRKLQVTDERENTRIIYHYQYTAWPDHGVPLDARKLLDFIEDINNSLVLINNKADAPQQNVLCVHCSAGVGRTATFIALDMLISNLNNAGEKCKLDIHSTVKLIRVQRMGMVQNKMQYKFIYVALQEYICNKYSKREKKALWSDV